MSAFAATASADRRLHVVDAGESLGALAVRYHVSVDDLRRWNALSGDTIQVGQELVVEEGPVLRYTTVPGDTLGCIATRFGVPVERIVADNEGVSPQRLDVGRDGRGRQRVGADAARGRGRGAMGCAPRCGQGGYGAMRAGEQWRRWLRHRREFAEGGSNGQGHCTC